MVNYLEPKLPSGSVGNKLKQAGEDAAGVAYVVVLALAAGGAAVWAYTKAKAFVMQRAQASNPNAPQSGPMAGLSGLFSQG